MAAMLGRSVGRTYPPKQPPAADAPSALTVRDLTAAGVTGASLEIGPGEIVGARRPRGRRAVGARPGDLRRRARRPPAS